MPKALDPIRLLLVAVGGWMNHQQQQVIDYLHEENRVLRDMKELFHPSMRPHRGKSFGHIAPASRMWKSFGEV